MHVRKIARSAVTGRFVSRAHADRCPAATLFESVTVPSNRTRRLRRRGPAGRRS